MSERQSYESWGKRMGTFYAKVSTKHHGEAYRRYDRRYDAPVDPDAIRIQAQEAAEMYKVFTLG